MLEGIKKRPPPHKLLIPFTTGVSMAIFINTATSMNHSQLRGFYQALYAPCVPVMLIGLFVYQYNGRIMEFLGLSLIRLSVVLFGLVTFFFFAKILIN